MAAPLLLAATAMAGCGQHADSAGTVARAVTAPPLPHTAPVSASKPGHQESRRDRAAASSARGTTERPRSQARARNRSGGILSSADAASFSRLAASLGGQQGLAVSPLGIGQRVQIVGSLRSAVAWSTSKVPIAMAVIADGGERAERADLVQAITASDNAAAMRLWSSLGGGRRAASAADEQLRRAGDSNTQVEYRPLRGAAYTPFGQTRWALRDQARFAAGMSCLSEGMETLGFMNRVVAAQRWGLGAAGVEAPLKGGWGPGSEPGVGGGYLDRQLGIMIVDGKPLAVAIASRPADGSHETGTHDLTAIARWLVTHANTRGVPLQPHC